MEIKRIAQEAVRLAKKTPLRPLWWKITGGLNNAHRIRYQEKWLPDIYRRYIDQPIDERKVILVERRYGEMSSSLRLLYEDLKKDGSFRVHVHCLQQSELKKLDYERKCARLVADAATAKYIFLTDASAPISCIPKREETKVIQLWHACGAFKKFGRSTEEKIFGMSRKEQERFSEYRNLNLVSVTSPGIVWAYEEAMGLQGKGLVKPFGSSRTDVFYDQAFIAKAKAHLQELFPSSRGKKVILFAPTFRGRTASCTTPDYQQFNLKKLSQALSSEYVVVIKHHPLIKEENLPKIPSGLSDFAFDAGGKLSIEELLCAADVLITDYSSVIFEFSLFEKPILFYAYDLGDFIDWRGFYYPYEELTPGPVLRAMDELTDCLVHLNERFEKKAVSDFREKFMSACDGHATERIEQEVFGRSLKK